MKPERQYQENRILNASPEELMIMLFDGAIRFCESAKSKLAEKEYEEYCRLLIRVHDILVELMNGLNREELGDPIYQGLLSLYQSIQDRVVEANLKKETRLLDESIKLLGHVRETWVLAIEKDRQERLASLVPAMTSQGSREGAESPSPLDLRG